jgi:hypothetical protein
MMAYPKPPIGQSDIYFCFCHIVDRQPLSINRLSISRLKKNFLELDERV